MVFCFLHVVLKLTAILCFFQSKRVLLVLCRVTCSVVSVCVSIVSAAQHSLFFVSLWILEFYSSWGCGLYILVLGLRTDSHLMNYLFLQK